MDVYEILRSAIRNKQQVFCQYDGHQREMCPHAIGTKNGESHCPINLGDRVRADCRQEVNGVAWSFLASVPLLHRRASGIQEIRTRALKHAWIILMLRSRTRFVLALGFSRPRIKPPHTRLLVRAGHVL